ncbi:MAG: cytochrome b/b6 domain-containing protein [Gammaproteobacteria bacterium]|nr:cytochrome b/b6 domain-containing protein [Gammaproteobacteria bacterium]
MDGATRTYPVAARLIHASMAVLGVVAYISAEALGDGPESLGFLLHAYFGLSLMAVLLLRIWYGISGPANLRFSSWPLTSRPQLQSVRADIRGLLRFRMQAHEPHQGLAGIVQAFGLALFLWMAATGTAIYFFVEMPKHPLFKPLAQLHEAGDKLILLYLLLHVGSVVLHSLCGSPVWQRMWKFGRAE